jgi:hypothetical protein
LPLHSLNGELDGQGRARAGALALRITGQEEQYELFATAERGAPSLRRSRKRPTKAKVNRLLAQLARLGYQAASITLGSSGRGSSETFFDRRSAMTRSAASRPIQSD